MTPATRQQIKNAAKQVIENYEPRAEVIDVLVEDYPAKNAITMSVAFFIINDPEPVVVDILLERVR
jgi:predicted component of type VI protein secretion system